MDKSLVISIPPTLSTAPPIYCGSGFAMRRGDGLWECRTMTPPIYCGPSAMPTMRQDGLWSCLALPPAGPLCTASIVYSQGDPSSVRIGAQDMGCDAGLEIALAAMLAALLKGP